MFVYCAMETTRLLVTKYLSLPVVAKNRPFISSSGSNVSGGSFITETNLKHWLCETMGGGGCIVSFSYLYILVIIVVSTFHDS